MSTRAPERGLTDAARFYATPRGALTASLLSERLRHALPRLADRRVLGLGFTAPYLAPLGCEFTRTVHARPDTALTRRPPLNLSRLKPAHALLDCVVDEATLPFDELSADVVLVIHALELVRDPREMLRAIWKTLADDGLLVLVVPNRTGWWAHGDSTPFGHGAPYSLSQIERTLAQAMFRAERISGALAIPPAGLGLGRRTSRAADRTLCLLGRHVAGVHVVIARKDVYAAVPLGQESAIGRLSRRILEPA